MTDDTTRNPAPGDEEQTTPVAEAMADARAALSRKGFSSPTGMIALAALLLIGVEVLFGLILAAYWVNAAMLSSRKNNPPNRKPSGICENAAGSAMNARPTPSPGSAGAPATSSTSRWAASP